DDLDCLGIQRQPQRGVNTFVASLEIGKLALLAVEQDTDVLGEGERLLLWVLAARYPRLDRDGSTLGIDGLDAAADGRPLGSDHRGVLLVRGQFHGDPRSDRHVGEFALLEGESASLAIVEQDDGVLRHLETLLLFLTAARTGGQGEGALASVDGLDDAVE